MLITGLYCTNRSIGVSQIAPGSIRADRNIDKPSGSCEKSWDCWDFVVGALSPSLCLQSATVGRCFVCYCVIGLLCPLSSLFHSSGPLGCQGKPFHVTCVSFVTSKHQPAAPPPSFPATSLLWYLCCFRASNPKQRERKDPQPLVQS